MKSGDLVRLDVGCEWSHYQGDLGQTIPASGHFSNDQCETWNIFVSAYHAGVAALRAGATVDVVFDAWRNELTRQRLSARSSMAQCAIDSWSDRMFLITNDGAQLLTPGVPYSAKEIEAAMR